MRTNRPNQGKFESWVSGRSAYDHPCALQHQTCSWKALWPPPRTAGGIFIPQLNFPGCILPYFIRADPPVAVISYIWPFLGCSLVLWNLGVLCCQSNAFSGFILSAFKTGFSSYSATSCYKQRGAPSLDGAPSQHPCPLLPLLGSFMNCRRLHGQFINDCKTSILKIWRKFLMKSTAAVGDGFFFEFQSLKIFEFPSITSTVKDGWGGQNPCPRSLNLKVWEDLWHSKSSISMLWIGWSSFSTSARCTSTTDEIENQRGAKSLPSA